MNILNRVLVIVFVVAVMAGAGAALLVAFEVLDPATVFADPWDLLLEPFRQVDSGTWGATVGVCLGVLSCGLLVLAIELRAPWGAPRGFLLSRGPLGRVTIARRGVEELVSREARGVNGVLEARAHVKQKRAGYQVVGRVSVSPETNVPELIREVQERVKAVVESHLGSKVSEVLVQTQLSPLSHQKQARVRVQ